MSERSSKRVAATVIASVLFAALTVVTVLVFLDVFSPRRPLPPVTLNDRVDYTGIREALTPEAVAKHHERILALGSRYIGHEGFYAAENLIREHLKAAGLQIFEYTNLTPAPHTLRRELLDESGAPLPDVEIWPFLPNQFQPIVTPDEGLRGKLLVVNDEVLRERNTFTDCIAVIDVAKPPVTFGITWNKYAMAGFQGVILTDSRGLESLPWTTLTTIADASQVNFARVLASPEILKHNGSSVVMHVRQQWKPTPNRTLIGLLRADRAQPNAEAIVIPCNYDAPSMVPDRTPGVLSAVPLATELALIDGLVQYKSELQRDVLFVFGSAQTIAQDAICRFVGNLGPIVDRSSTLRRLERELADATHGLERSQAALKLFEDEAFFADAGRTTQALAGLSEEDRAEFDGEVRYVLNSLVVERNEALLAARVPFVLAPAEQQTPEHEIGARYFAAKKAYDDALSAAGYPVDKLLRTQAKLVKEADIRGRVLKRFTTLVEHYAFEKERITQGLNVHKTMAAYRSVYGLASDLIPADPERVKGEAVSFSMGAGQEAFAYIQHPGINNLVQSVYRRGKFSSDLKYDPLQPKKHSDWAATCTATLPLSVEYLNRLSYASFSLINSDRLSSYQAMAHPIELPWMRQLGTIRHSLRLMADVSLSMALGAGSYLPPQKILPTTFSGRIYVANVGQSIVPNYPLVGAIVGSELVKEQNNGAFGLNGYIRNTLLLTDATGRYSMPDSVAPIQAGPDYSPSAFGYDRDGRIIFAKDKGPLGQAVYKSTAVNLSTMGGDNINIVVFRASPVAIFDLVNPQTLKTYTGVEFVSREGLTGLERINQIVMNDSVTTFLEPDRFFYVKLLAGAPGNEKARSTRAFILGIGERDYRLDPSREIDGPGFLAYNTPFLLDMPQRIAESMLHVNSRRLELQERHGMADERTKEFHAKAREFLARSKESGLSYQLRMLAARDAVTYATLNHPVMRENIFEAVVGILWYLGLLVPFVFFFEKLAFGFTDIRKQLAAQAIIFLVVFLLLRLLHPAFEMIRSSLMILLGFVILLISGGITLLSSGKFSENLEELRKRRGKVTAAEVNTAGVIGTAFMLGLNNMHRRRVRTMLTCATLVLITFAMICFTSIHSDLVDMQTATGKAPYQGFVVKPEKFNPVEEGELFALRYRYSDRYKVAPRTMYIGTMTWERLQYNADFEAIYEPEGGAPKRHLFDSAIILDPHEPLRDRVKFVSPRQKWFEPDRQYAPSDAVPILIPDRIAQALGIDPADVTEESDIRVRVNGRICTILGVYDSAAFDAIRDLDGQDLLPFDTEAIVNLQTIQGYTPIADEDDPRITSDRLILTPVAFDSVPNGKPRTVSVAVDLGDLPYREARKEIDTFLEQSQRSLAYGLDGVAYSGKRARESSFGGLVELLIPLVIAALTVLNTMRGSVYERRDEIFVYNAVGIAPKYIFFMFIAEAFVYAVVGCVLGYILSQGTGRILTMLDWTGGLNMTFTSLSTIFASLAITVAVFVSTYFPARSAMEIAAPSEEVGWRLPPSENDLQTFDLPFTFDPPDRVAVLAFFRRYFLDHGEGSAGAFFASVPELEVAEEPPGSPAAGAYMPQLTCVVWLKPFDLGVSQRVTIRMPADPQTGEYIANVQFQRLSGTREAWERLNVKFVSLVRRHFLHWRATSPTDRAEMFNESRQLLESAFAPEGPSTAQEAANV